MPLEISRECLLDASRALAGEYPSVRFDAVCADYSQALDFPADLPGYRWEARRDVVGPGTGLTVLLGWPDDSSAGSGDTA